MDTNLFSFLITFLGIVNMRDGNVNFSDIS